MKHTLTHYTHCFVRALFAVALVTLPSVVQAARPTDQIIVKPKPGHDLVDVHARAKTRLKKKLKNADLEVVQIPAGGSVDDALAHYGASADVDYAEPDHILSANAVPNDSRYTDGTLWALHNTGQSAGQNDADIDGPEAWDVRSSAQNIVVAVVDSGVRYTHEDLAANMWRNPGEVPGNGRDDDHNGYVDDVHGISPLDGTGHPIDGNGHGTHVAGTIAASGNNGRGVVGVAWRAQIMALRFLDGNGEGYTSDAIIAFDYARTKGASVVNASFAGPYSAALRDAITRARGAGMIIVAAAGNEASNNDLYPSYPANYAMDNVVSVAATTRNDALANFSNYGASTVHLAAPGRDIYSTYFLADNAYIAMSGTSMAAPHVAGALALVRAQFTNDTHQQSIDRLLRAVDPVPALAGSSKTGGRLNLHRALQSNATGAATLVQLAMLRTNQQIRLRLTGAAGQVCQIEQTTDLVQWTSAMTVTLSATGSLDLDVNIVNQPRRIFRTRSL